MHILEKRWRSNCQHNEPQLRIKLRLLVLLLLLPCSMSAAPALTQRGQPALLAWAVEHPATMVKIIVQKALPHQTIEQWVQAAGGVVTRDLSIINAFAAEVPTSQVAALAMLPGVKWLSFDAPVVETACMDCIDTTKLVTLYNKSVRADQVWNNAPYLQGQGIGIAVLDSGIKVTHPDIGNRVVVNVDKGGRDLSATDGYGHGTLVAGVIAGNGSASGGAYLGIAPKANLINVKVTTIVGISNESDVVSGLQWIYDNYKAYNIKVVNISLNSSIAQSYHTSPMDAAAEVLWFNGIVVVVAAGNNGSAKLYPPANDPFVITVGATDEGGTAAIDNDVVAAFSAYGVTESGFAKPDLVAPGRNVVGPLSHQAGRMALLHPANIVNASYFRMSGTSVSAPIVSGAVALLLQDEPQLTPDQVKYRLMATANKKWAGYSVAKAGAGYLDIAAAVLGKTTKSANTGLPVSNLLTTGPAGVLSASVNWSSVNWSSVNWSSVNWSSVNWSSVNWSTVNWSSDYWELTGKAVDFDSEEPTDQATTAEELTSAIALQSQKVFLPLVAQAP